ncbi:hypothetical protein D3C84_278180 [compost metagenome]
MLVVAFQQVDAVGAAREEVHRRGAEGLELLGGHRAFEAGVETVEQHHQLQFLADGALHATGQAPELDEEETVGQGEVLLQQAVSLEGAGHHRQRRVAVVEAPGAQLLQLKRFGPLAVGAAQEQGAGIAQQLFVETERLLVGAVQEQRQVVEGQ